jgi:LmbE family N-acetylglucosaminyl deacetylase
MNINRYESVYGAPDYDGDYVRHDDHIAALEAVKATVKQFPCAWMVRENEQDHWDFVRLKLAADDLAAKGFEVVPLYAAPSTEASR